MIPFWQDFYARNGGDIINLTLFRTYIKVVDNNNISRAAEELNLSQPAVSKQIQVLEERYGVLLLERSGQKLKTTEAGKALYSCAQEILKLLDKTRIMEDISEVVENYDIGG